MRAPFSLPSMQQSSSGIIISLFLSQDLILEGNFSSADSVRSGRSYSLTLLWHAGAKSMLLVC